MLYAHVVSLQVWTKMKCNFYSKNGLNIIEENFMYTAICVNKSQLEWIIPPSVYTNTA